MPRVLSSPVKKWPGTITLADPLTFPQLIAWSEANERAAEIVTDDRKAKGSERSREFFELLKGVLPCVEAWDLKDFPSGVTAENFPASGLAGFRLIAFLNAQISAQVREADDDVPNG